MYPTNHDVDYFRTESILDIKNYCLFPDVDLDNKERIRIRRH